MVSSAEGLEDRRRPRPAADAPSARRITPAERRRYALVICLTFGTGAVDAVCFMHLGGAFSSVMTGNMVLLGLSLTTSALPRALLVCIAIIGYIAGVTVGAYAAGRAGATDSVWPSRVTVTLGIETALLVALSVLWLLRGTTAGIAPDQTMLAVASTALGIQSSAIQRFGVSGLSSTYLTGTLTTVISGFAARRPFGQQLPGVLILGSLIVGAATAAFVAVLPLAVPVIVLAPIVAVLVSALVIEWDDAHQVQR
jgi:uncharacterized membrane protein YoaK (UPF0700 family)